MISLIFDAIWASLCYTLQKNTLKTNGPSQTTWKNYYQFWTMYVCGWTSFYSKRGQKSTFFIPCMSSCPRSLWMVPNRYLHQKIILGLLMLFHLSLDVVSQWFLVVSHFPKDVRHITSNSWLRILLIYSEKKIENWAEIWPGHWNAYWDSNWE